MPAPQSASEGPRRPWRILTAIACLVAPSCGDPGTGPGNAETSIWTAQELSVLQELTLAHQPALPPDPSNQYGDDPRAAALGKQLFSDTRLSGNGEVACATCHIAAQQFQDGTPLAHGVGTTARRTMPVMSTAHNSWQFWDGRKDSQWSQALGPLESPVEHNTTRVGVVRVLAQHYSATYTAIFGALPDLAGLPLHAGPVADATAAEAWTTIPVERQDAINRAFANLGKAIAAFERRIAYGESRFDRFVNAVVAGEPVPATVRLTLDEQAGARLFVGKGECINCHTGPLLTDQQFHNLGIPGAAGLATDEGRWAGVRVVRDDPFNCLGVYSDALPTDCTALQHLNVDVAALLGAFKTPSLRNVAERAPYMHAGQLASLETVIDHYDRAPAAEIGTNVLRPLQLTAGERAQLVAFLRSLSGSVEVPVE